MTDLLVVGAGPAGLSCAIEAVRAKLSCVILDQGNVADAIRRFPVNMVWFSTPELLEIGDVPFTVTTVRPTRADTLRYYLAVAARFGLDVRPHDAVTGIRREGEGFVVSTAGGRIFRPATWWSPRDTSIVLPAWASRAKRVRGSCTTTPNRSRTAAAG